VFSHAAFRFPLSAFRILIAYGGPSRTQGSRHGQSDVRVGPQVQLESESHQFGKPASGWRRRLHEIVFQSDTPAGKLFDIVLIAAILLSGRRRNGGQRGAYRAAPQGAARHARVDIHRALHARNTPRGSRASSARSPMREASSAWWT
jgi:hypothetical protein